MIARLVLAATALAVASPALATGKMTCNAGPQNTWKSQEALKASLVKQGWQVRKSKVDGGCYEVYGTDEKGNRVPMDVKAGDKVLYGKYSGTEVTVGGEQLLILRESDVLAKIES